MARLAYECNLELRSGNISIHDEAVKPYACTVDKYCLYCCCNPQCCLLIQRRPPKHFWEAWYFWLGIALLILFILSSVSSYVVSNCRHNFHTMTMENNNRTTAQAYGDNAARVGELVLPANEISIHVIPTTGILLPSSHRKMLLYAPQPSATHMTPIVA